METGERAECGSELARPRSSSMTPAFGFAATSITARQPDASSIELDDFGLKNQRGYDVSRNLLVSRGCGGWICRMLHGARNALDRPE